MSEVPIVVEQAELQACCDRWRAAGRFAFDTEFVRDDSYDANLGLVQVACGDEVVLIDPVDGLDLTEFWALVSAPEITTIVHAGKEDCELCLRRTGQVPRNLFDVQIAAGFVGYGYPLSLSRLVLGVAHKRVAKGATLTDWMRRPLTEDQLRYAIDDVVYLPAIFETLSTKLEEASRMSWAEEEFRRFEDAEFYKPPAVDRLFKLKGARKLDGRCLAVLARLIEWRDRWAEERNRPVRALVRDDILVDIARRHPTRPDQVEVLRGFPQARNRKIVDELLKVIADGLAVAKEDRPTAFVSREESPMDKAVLDILSAYNRAVCHDEGVDHDLVGGAKRLRELIDHRLDPNLDCPSLLTGWRKQFIGERTLDLLEGRTELHLSGWPQEPHLEVITHTAKNR